MTRELFTDLSLELTYVYKYTNNFRLLVQYNSPIEPVAYLDDFSATSPSPFTIRRPPTGVQCLHTYNPPQLKQKYRAFIIAPPKRLSNNWQMSASFVSSKANGVSSGDDQLNQSALDRQSRIQTNSSTILLGQPSPERQDLHVQAPGDLLLALRLQHQRQLRRPQTGKPIARTITVTGMNQGTFTVLAEPRGSQYRLDACTNLDFGWKKHSIFRAELGPSLSRFLQRPQ